MEKLVGWINHLCILYLVKKARKRNKEKYYATQFLNHHEQDDFYANKK